MMYGLDAVPEPEVEYEESAESPLITMGLELVYEDNLLLIAFGKGV